MEVAWGWRIYAWGREMAWGWPMCAWGMRHRDAVNSNAEHYQLLWAGGQIGLWER